MIFVLVGNQYSDVTSSFPSYVGSDFNVSSVFKTFGSISCVLLRGYSGTWAVVYIIVQFSQPFLCCHGSALCMHS